VLRGLQAQASQARQRVVLALLGQPFRGAAQLAFGFAVQVVAFQIRVNPEYSGASLVAHLSFPITQLMQNEV